MVLDRRRFLQTSLAFGIGAGVHAWLPGKASAAFTTRASVLEFGADPTGERDVTLAVQKAIASLPRREARLVFPAGKYRFAASRETAMQFTGFDGIEVFANNAELLFSGDTLPFHFYASKGVALHDMRVEWERPAFVQGVVLEASPGSFLLELEPGFLLNGPEAFTGLVQFDAASRGPARLGLNLAGLEMTALLLDANRIRIEHRNAARLAPLRAGMLLLLHRRPAGASASFTLDGCQGVFLDEVTVHHAPATAFLLRGCRDISVDGVTIAARPGRAAMRMLAALGDGMRCSDCHGTLAIKDAHFEGLGGDALNIYQSYWTMTARPDDRTAAMASAGGTPFQPGELPRPGDFVQFSEPATLALLGEVGVTAIRPQRTAAMLTLGETLSPVLAPGTLLCGVVDAPRIAIDHSVFCNTLGRGVVLHTRAEVTSNHFRGCAREAILLAPDLAERQGPSVQNVRIRENTFDGCNTSPTAGGKQQRGIITIDALPGLPEDARALNSAVRIQGNTFLGSSGAAVYAASLDGLLVAENIFGHAPGKPSEPAAAAPVAIFLRSVANADISANTSDTPQLIATLHCTQPVAAEGNHLLSVVNQG